MQNKFYVNNEVQIMVIGTEKQAVLNRPDEISFNPTACIDRVKRNQC